MKSIPSKASEHRTELVLNDLLISQGWDTRRPPYGDVLLQSEYRAYPDLLRLLATASKTGPGAGLPEAIVVNRATKAPLMIVEAKASLSAINTALTEAQGYCECMFAEGHYPLAVGIVGSGDDTHLVRVSKWTGHDWEPVTYDGNPISWLPSKEDAEKLSIIGGPTELRPSIPPPEVLADRANEINRLLREANVKDEFRPAVVAAIMLALWSSKGQLRRDPEHILVDINEACRKAFWKAKKHDLADSLGVDEANEKLAVKAKRIAAIVERLNVTVLTAEHDYLGQLYETFFRYTGGNTIGQYFTPRHITKMMADLCEVGIDDVVLDPSCGTGGFLVACMDRLLKTHNLNRTQVVSIIRKQLIGFETEPVTAALCVANMILRGDGSTRVFRGDCFTSDDYPVGKADVALMNPPFPHKNTDVPAEAFVEQGLLGLRNGGRLAVILPTSILVKKDKGLWRSKILAKNSLVAVCQLPDELFQPFAAATTSIVILEKGRKHDPVRKTVFVRLHHDGLTLKKGFRAERTSEPNQIPYAVECILNKLSVPGFSGVASISGSAEWAAGGYIPSAEPERDELRAAIDVHLRRLASFYIRYGDEVVAQRKALTDGELEIKDYRDVITKKRSENAKALSSGKGTMGGQFEIVYGMKELHSRDGIAPGGTLVISPTEAYNGCYGWLEFGPVLKPPFVTVAQTGSIGEAFAQFEPCAVNDDCLVLLPKADEGVTEAKLLIASATLHAERWRFTYGRKLTPQRIAEFKLPDDPDLEAWVHARIEQTKKVVLEALKMYDPAETKAFYGSETD